jgi:hypothetical protein
MTERRERKPTPPPKTPALVRRGVVALAVGLGLSGAACGGEVVGDSQPPQPTPKGDAGAKGMGGTGGKPFDEAGLGAYDGTSPWEGSAEDAGDDVEWLTPDAGTDAPDEADSDEDVRIVPILPPPPPPLPPPLPPK